MKIRTLLLLLVLAAVAGFAILNWNTIMTPTPLSLGVAEVQAPLGLVMLGLSVFLTTLFLVYVVYLQTSVLMETRRNSRELHANRKLADQAEASRFTELRSFLEAELKRQASEADTSKTALLARLDQVDRDLQTAIEQSGNSLSAYIGELENRLENAPGRSPST